MSRVIEGTGTAEGVGVTENAYATDDAGVTGGARATEGAVPLRTTYRVFQKECFFKLALMTLFYV